MPDSCTVPIPDNPLTVPEFLSGVPEPERRHSISLDNTETLQTYAPKFSAHFYDWSQLSPLPAYNALPVVIRSSHRPAI